MITVVIADDDVPTRVGLRAILESEPQITVVAEATTGPDACTVAEQYAPDVMLMDIRMPGFSGIEATRRICSWAARGPGEGPKVIVLTTFDRLDYADAARRAGAKAVLLKRQTPAEIIHAVLLAARGPTARATTGPAETGPERARWAPAIESLTHRQRDVLALIASGRSNQEIARTLCVSPETVKSHIKRIFLKLGLRDRAQAVVVAYESGLVEPRLNER